MLAGLLRSSGVAGRPEEYFWRDDVPSWRERWGATSAQEYLEGVLREGTTSNGVFGARVMWAYLDDVVAAIRNATGHEGARHAVLSAAFPRIRYVHLRRQDRVAQAVSWAKAAQSGVWFAGDDRDEPRAMTYDRDLIGDLLAAIQEGEHGWESFFVEADVKPYEIVYEELAADPIGTATSLIGFLGVDVRDVHLETHAERQFDATNSEWISRFRSEHRLALGDGKGGRPTGSRARSTQRASLT